MNTLVVQNPGLMTRAQNSRGTNSVVVELLGRRICRRKIKEVSELLKVKKKEIHGGTTVAVMLREKANSYMLLEKI